MEGVADELVVVDNDSSDGSADVGRSFGARVLSESTRIQDQARNLYLDAATGDWILVLDADERLTANSRSAIRKAVAQAASDVSAIVLPIMEYTGFGRWFHNPTVYRLFRRDPRIRYGSDVHHATVGQAANAVGEVVDAYGPLHHLGLLVTPDGKAKRESVRRSLQATWIQGRNDPRAAAFLGLEELIRGRFAVAEELLRESIRLDPTAQPRALQFLAYLYLATEQLDRAEEVALTEVPPQHAPTFRDLMAYVLAEVAVRRGDRAAAAEICTRALALQPKAPVMHLNLAALIADGSPELALAHLERAAELNPFVSEPVIYGPAARPNLFSHSVSFLSSTPPYLDQMVHCHELLGDERSAGEWRRRRQGIDLAPAPAS